MKEVESEYKKNVEKPKILKDFTFLFDIKPQFLSDKVVKFMLKEGEGEVLSQLKLSSFKVYYSYIIYDYNGKLLQKNPIAKVYSHTTSDPLTVAILSMKIKEKSWFNICNQRIPYIVSHGDDKNSFSDANQGQLESNIKLDRSGLHYEIQVQIIQYKNCENIEVKRHICLQNRQKGHKLMNEKKYFDAAIAFKSIVGMSQKFSKKKYSEQEQDQIRHMNINGKFKYLQCYFNIDNKNILKNLAKTTQKFILFLLKYQYKDFFTHYYHTKWLIMVQKYDEALQSARAASSIKKAEKITSLITEIAKLKKRSLKQKEY